MVGARWNTPQNARFIDVGLKYIEARIAQIFEHILTAGHTLKTISVLDADCGGGFVLKPLVALSAEVVKVDTAARYVEF